MDGTADQPVGRPQGADAHGIARVVLQVNARRAGGQRDVRAVVHDDAGRRPARPHDRLLDQRQEAAVGQAGLTDLHEVDTGSGADLDDPQHPFDRRLLVRRTPGKDAAVGHEADHQGAAIVSNSDGGLNVRRCASE